MRLLLALAGALALSACGEPEREWPAAAPAVWEVAGENGEQGWLFGTIHALPDGVEWRSAAFEKAFAASDLLMFEVGNLQDAEASRKAFDAYAREEGLPALSTRVASADRAALAALMAKAEMTDEDFWDVKTWAAALMLGNAVRTSETGNGVDRALLDEVKPVEALETFAGQFERFDGLSEKEQRQLLAAVAHEAEAEETDQQVEAWLTGDIGKIERRMASSFLNRPALREVLLVERNRLFAGRVALALEQGRKPFVAVGAAHMLGPDGLPALLAARGYAVRRVQ